MGNNGTSNSILMVDIILLLRYLFCLFVKSGLDVYSALSTWQGPFTEKDASRLLVHLCSALQYLHSVNIVHRHVKPDNCLVSNTLGYLIFKKNFF